MKCILKKFFTKTFKVVVFSQGKFCWKNPKWEDKSKDDLEEDVICLCLAVIILSSLLYLK